jgi:IS30 family transposase
MGKLGMTKRRHFRNLNKSDRLKLEALYNTGAPVKEIAQFLGFDVSSIYREIKRGLYYHTNSDFTENIQYSSDLGQIKHDTLVSNCGRNLKIGNDQKFADFLEYKMASDGYSPEAALFAAEKEDCFETKICVRTLYNYIDNDLFVTVSNKNLPIKGHRHSSKKRVHPVQKRRCAGKSIDQRPENISVRKEFGHWEMDTVKGKQGVSKSCLLVLSERKTRKELVYKMEDQGSASVVKRINWLERQLGKGFSQLFKSITMDNGVEFSDVAGLEKSQYSDKKRTELFYCHAYSSWERGTNENINKMVRRKIPKGADTDIFSEEFIRETERWINNYPRRLFSGQSANDRFKMELLRLDNVDRQKIESLLV